MPAAQSSSLEFVELAVDAYLAGKTIKMGLLVAQTVTPSPANGFVSAIVADEAAVARQSVSFSTDKDTVANPDRVEMFFGLVTFPSVGAGVGVIKGLFACVDSGADATSPIVLHIWLNDPDWVTPDGNDIVVSQGSDGVVHLEVMT